MSDAAAPLDAVAPGTLGEDEKDSAGYSWIVRLLPFMEEQILYDELLRSSTNQTVRPFETDVNDSQGEHVSARQLSAVRCPAYAEKTVTYGAGSEYDDLAIQGRAAISSYAAVVGTHADPAEGIQENGILVSRCEMAPETCRGEGVRLEDIGDGISQTIIICETNEPIYSAWYDGQAAWVVGLTWQDSDASDERRTNVTRQPMLGQSGYSDIALGRRWPGRLARDRGPGSDHPDGVVMHAFADAHARGLTREVDPAIYYRLITRDGGERVAIDEL